MCFICRTMFCLVYKYLQMLGSILSNHVSVVHDHYIQSSLFRGHSGCVEKPLILGCIIDVICIFQIFANSGENSHSVFPLIQELDDWQAHMQSL